MRSPAVFSQTLLFQHAYSVASPHMLVLARLYLWLRENLRSARVFKATVVRASFARGWVRVHASLSYSRARSLLVSGCACVLASVTHAHILCLWPCVRACLPQLHMRVSLLVVGCAYVLASVTHARGCLGG